MEACANAIADAGLKGKDIDGIMCYRAFPPAAGENPVTPYLVSQHHDIFAFQFWKKKTAGRFLWLRNNASTMVSQAIDSILFCTIALWGLFDTTTWLQILATTYFLKWIVAAVDTPYIYLAKKISKTVLENESKITLVEEG